MTITLENKQGLIAGDGILPVRMAQYAKENGFEVVCISLSRDNVRDLKKYCSKVYSCHPGEVNRIESILRDEQIKQLTFLGKVHKKVLLQLHKFDKRAIDLIKDEAGKFFKQQNLSKALNKAQDIIKKGNSSDYYIIEDIIRNALETNTKQDMGFRLFDDIVNIVGLASV